MEPQTVHYAKQLAYAIFTLNPKIHVIMYHSKQYDSVYLKFDLGVANSCRIADHESKKQHLGYRFNILLDTKQIKRDDSGKYPKFFYPPSEIATLAQVIVSNAENKLATWGDEKYRSFMESNLWNLPHNDWQLVQCHPNGDVVLTEYEY